MDLPNIMRLASAPSPIWCGQLLAWLPVDIMLQRTSEGKKETWRAMCGEVEAEGWKLTVALCRLVILLHEAEVNAS